MQFGEMRFAVQEMFAKALALRKAGILTKGRLSLEDLSSLQNTRDLSDQAVSDNEFPSLVLEEAHLAAFAAARAPSIKPGSPEFRTLATEYHRGLRDYADGVLRFDTSLDRFHLEAPAVAAELSETAADNKVSLLALVELYKLERSKDAVAARSAKEWDDHFALLYEILGSSDTLVQNVGETHAQKVKNTLLDYPKNRRKNSTTKHLSLSDALAVTTAAKIAVPKINKYLQTYSSLFEWAKRNHYVSKNYFDGLSVVRKKSKGGLRDPFSAEQLRTIVEEATFGRKGLVEHDWQKWGILLAVYTGARLNEIAQLLLTDVGEIDGIACLAITDVDDGEPDDQKQLKTDAAKRAVPLHSELIASGFLEYVQQLRDGESQRLFPEFTRDLNNGWGRKLGRWANDTFLVRLGYKRPRIVFHSFRHAVITQLGQAGVQEPIIKALVGHEQQGVLQTSYFAASGYTVSQLADAIEHLQPGGLAAKRGPEAA